MPFPTQWLGSSHPLRTKFILVGVALGVALGVATFPIHGDLIPNGTFNGLAFNPTSDRNAKQAFSPVAPQAVLEKVAAQPILSWARTNAPGVKHYGPMAQDFREAFGLGEDDKHIATVDAAGVALAAIQGLNQKLTEELKRRDAENAELKERLQRLEQLVNQQIPGNR